MMTYRSTNFSVLVLGLLAFLNAAAANDESKEEAEGSLQKARELARQGRESYDKGQNEAARYFFSEAISVAPDEAVFYRLKAFCDIRLKDLEQAISYLKEVIHKDENNHMDQHLLVELLHACGRVDGDDLAALNDTYLVLLGCKFFNDEQFEKALSCFDEAITKNQYNPFAHEKRGHCYRKLGQLEEAIKDYEQTLTLLPMFYLSVEIDLLDMLLRTKRRNYAREVLERIKNICHKSNIIPESMIRRVGEFEEKLQELNETTEDESQEEAKFDTRPNEQGNSETQKEPPEEHSTKHGDVVNEPNRNANEPAEIMTE